MKLPPLKLTFDYSDTPERRAVSLEKDGILCVPVIGYDKYRKVWSGPDVHRHPECLELSLCLRGSLDFEFRGSVRKLLPGNMAVSGPDDLHRFRSYPKHLSKYWMLFRLLPRGFSLLKLPPKEARWLARELAALPGRIFNGEQLEPIFQRIFCIYDEVPPNTPERSLQLRSAVIDLLLGVVACSKLPPRMATNAGLKGIIEEMSAFPEHRYPVPELARQMGVSISNFMTRFKKLTGLPPHAFLMARRIDKAKGMLAHGNMSVTAIASALGFSSSQHFATSFISATGKTPRQWKISSTNERSKT